MLYFAVSIVPIIPNVDATANVSKRASRSWLRPLVAALFSSLVPGTGQLLINQRKKGLILLGLLAVTMICFWPLRLPRFYVALILLCWYCIAVYLYAACSAILSSRASKWWLAVVVPLTLVGLWFVGDAGIHSAGFRLLVIPSSSMEPTIRQGDRIIADMRYYKRRDPIDGEMILFERAGTTFVKRVIASGGDTIFATRGSVYVNGRVLQEPYVQHFGQPLPWMIDFGPITVPAKNYFVMGDNRDVSLDSRSADYGYVSSDSIVGKPLYTVSSDRIGKPLM